MAHIQISKDVRPIWDLKAKAAEIVRQVNDSRRPVILTRHGRSVAVILSVMFYSGESDSIIIARVWDTRGNPEEFCIFEGDE